MVLTENVEMPEPTFLYTAVKVQGPGVRPSDQHRRARPDWVVAKHSKRIRIRRNVEVGAAQSLGLT